MTEEQPEKEIMVDPKWPIFVDGLGYQLLNTGGMPGIDKDGREIIIFTLIPDEVVRKRYNLRRGVEVDELGRFKLIVLEKDIVFLNPYDEANRKLLYVKTLRHERTNISEREEDL